MSDCIRVKTEPQIAILAKLAREIWLEHYVPIIGQAQVDYMLETFQSEAAIAAQIAGGQEYYLLSDEAVHVGYLGLVPDTVDSAMMISKIYVISERRGDGFGWKMLDLVESLCRERRISTLWLTVNKNNIDAINWYKRMGFSNAGPVVQGIGGGFVMDDYRMEKQLPLQ